MDGVLPGLLIAMVGTGLFNPTVVSVALGSVHETQSGLASGVNDTFRQAGIAIGVAALGALIPTGDVLNGGSRVAYVDGLQHALLAGAGLALIGAVASWALVRDRRPAALPAGAVAEAA